ncbi:MAG: hypothetical protein R2774_07900 [Saprospiraceae bacterium]
MPTRKHTTILLMSIATLLMAIQILFFHGGYFGYDEIWYSKIAASVIQGEFTHFHLYAYRYSMFLPLAMLYKIFGINDFSNFLFNMIQHLIQIYIIVQIINKDTFKTKWLAVLYYICMPIVTLYIEKTMPDIVVMTGFTMMLYGYYQNNFQLKSNDRAPFLWFIFGAILSFFAKETFLIFYPIFLILAANDVFMRKTNIRFWKWVMLSLSLFLLLYLLGNYIWFGDPLQRMHTIFSFSYVHDCSYDLQPRSVLLKRIGYELWFSFIRNGILLPLLFLPLLIQGYFDPSYRFLYKIWLGCMILANFMTISYSSYVPLCPDPRHFMFAFPIGAIVFAKGFDHLPKNTTLLLWSISVSVSMLAVSLIYHFEHTWYLYIPLMIGLVLYFTSKIILSLVFICIGLLSMYLVHLKYNHKVNYADQKKLTSYVLDHANEKTLVVTDPANVAISGYIQKFDTTWVRFVDFKEYDTIPKDMYKKSFLILNGMTLTYANQQWENLPEFVQHAHETLNVVYKNKSGDVYQIR